MLNKIMMEGYIAGSPWTFDGDIFARLACPRDPHRLPKPNPLNPSENSDFVTLRFPQSRFGGVPLSLVRGVLYRVEGYIQSRTYRETLGRFVFVATAQVEDKASLPDLNINDASAQQLAVRRAQVELVVETLVISPLGTVRRTDLPKPQAFAQPQTVIQEQDYSPRE